jgi:hypothetical protein
MSAVTEEMLRHHIEALTDELKILRMQPSRKLDEITLAFKSIENDVHDMKERAKDDKQLAAVQKALNSVHRALVKLTDTVQIRTPQTLAAFDKMFLTETHPTFGGRKNINYPNSNSSLDSDEMYSSSSDDDEMLKDDDEIEDQDKEDSDATSQDKDDEESDATSKDEESDVTSKDGEKDDDEKLASDDETDSDQSNSFLASDSDLDESQIF